MKLGPDMIVKPTECPTCGAVLDGAMSAQGGDFAPEAGDVGMCMQCLGWHEWLEPGLARFVTLRYVLDKADSREQANDIVKMVIAMCEVHAEAVREKRIKIVRLKEKP